MGFWKEEKAQGSIELLLLVAGAIVVVTIVGFIVKSMATTAAGEAQGVS